MAKKAYIGIDNIAKEVKKMYVGVDGVARAVKAAYIGDSNGIARKFYSSSTPYGFILLDSSWSGIPLRMDELVDPGTTRVRFTVVAGGGGSRNSGPFQGGGGGGGSWLITCRILELYMPHIIVDIGNGGNGGSLSVSAGGSTTLRVNGLVDSEYVFIAKAFGGGTPLPGAGAPGGDFAPLDESGVYGGIEIISSQGFYGETSTDLNGGNSNFPEVGGKGGSTTSPTGQDGAILIEWGGDI